MQRMLLAALVACLFVGAGWAAAQQVQPPRVPANPSILSGADIGFRVEGKTRQGGVMGTLMVRLGNEEWVEAQSAPWNGRGIPLAK